MFHDFNFDQSLIKEKLHKAFVSCNICDEKFSRCKCREEDLTMASSTPCTKEHAGQASVQPS